MTGESSHEGDKRQAADNDNDDDGRIAQFPHDGWLAGLMRSGLSEGTRLDESQVLRISFPVSKGGGDNADSGGRSGNSQRMISAELAGQREVGEFMIRRK